MSTPTGEVFRTDAPNGGDTWWRLFRGGTEYGTLFNEAANTHFSQNAPEGHHLWQTNGLQRMQLNQAQNITIGSFTVPTDGFLGVGLDIPTSWLATPWTRLHLLDRDYDPQVSGLFRDWMRNGLTMSSQYDQVYVGQKADDSDANAAIHAVFQWGANHDEEAEPSLARFIYAGPYIAASPGENSLFGKEIMQLHPSGFVGLGDWNAAALSPAERLDVLDGNVRIRALPGTADATSLSKYMVVDANGVVHWRSLPTSLANCEWFRVGVNSQVLSGTATAGTGGGCPDKAWKYGIGTSTTNYKLNIEHTEASSSGSGGFRSDFFADGTGQANGIYTRVTPAAGFSSFPGGYGIFSDVYNVGQASTPGTTDGYGLLSRVSHTASSVFARFLYGAYGDVLTSDGTVTGAYGLYGGARINGGTVTSSYGAYTKSSTTGSGAITNSYGVQSYASNGSNYNYGVWA